jgi:hypothetical protein
MNFLAAAFAVEAIAPSILYWVLILSPGLPLLALDISYRRILTQKTRELEARFKSFPDLQKRYEGAYGSPQIREYLENFHHWKTYLVPIVITSIVASAFAALALIASGVDLGLPSSIQQRIAQRLPATLLAGAAGAYLWGLFDLLERHGSADLSSTAIHSTWLRILLAAAIGPIFASAFNEHLAVAVAFTIGGLPIRQIRHLANNKFGFGTQSTPDQLFLNLVQGMTPRARERLADEEIDSVERLAFADPVRLLTRTNIEWNVILDLIDQAILINFVGDKIGDLRLLGVRGAIELAELYYRKEPSESNEEDAHHARQMFVLLGEKLYPDAPVENSVNIGRDAAYNLSYQLANDPLVEFVWEHWMSPYDDTSQQSNSSE